jgi:hypothetical protein
MLCYERYVTLRYVMLCHFIDYGLPGAHAEHNAVSISNIQDGGQTAIHTASWVWLHNELKFDPCDFGRVSPSIMSIMLGYVRLC